MHSHFSKVAHFLLFINKTKHTETGPTLAATTTSSSLWQAAAGRTPNQLNGNYSEMGIVSPLLPPRPFPHSTDGDDDDWNCSRLTLQSHFRCKLPLVTRFLALAVLPSHAVDTGLELCRRRRRRRRRERCDTEGPKFDQVRKSVDVHFCRQFYYRATNCNCCPGSFVRCTLRTSFWFNIPRIVIPMLDLELHLQH